VTPLRVGLVCPYSFARPGGVQNHVLGLAGWLHSRGHHVAVLAPGRPGPSVLSRHGLPESVFTSAGPAIPLAYNGSVARVGFGPWAAVRVRRWLAQGEFDLLHLHEPMTPSASLLALAQTRVPVVATFHTATPGSRTMALAYRLLPGAVARISGAIAVSGEAARVAGRHAGISPQVVGNGISLQAHPESPCTGRWRGGKRPRVCFVGRYDEPRKGFELLLAALPAVRRVHPDLEVVVVGHGSSRAGTDVHFLGPLDDEGRNRLLAHTDAYVAPHTGRESFGIVLLEAMASGAPVVASDLPAFREVVSDGLGPVAELFEPGSAEDLGRALLRSLAKPRDVDRVRARRRAAAFDWASVGPRIEDVYRDAVRSPRPGIGGPSVPASPRLET